MHWGVFVITVLGVIAQETYSTAVLKTLGAAPNSTLGKKA
jgi:hypothetical protein